MAEYSGGSLEGPLEHIEITDTPLKDVTDLNDATYDGVLAEDIIAEEQDIRDDLPFMPILHEQDDRQPDEVHERVFDIEAARQVALTIEEAHYEVEPVLDRYMHKNKLGQEHRARIEARAAELGRTLDVFERNEVALDLIKEQADLPPEVAEAIEQVRPHVEAAMALEPIMEPLRKQAEMQFEEAWDEVSARLDWQKAVAAHCQGKEETYKTSIEYKYLLAHIDTRRAFYESLPDVPYMDTDAFREWLEIMRCLLEYRKADSTLHEKSVTDKHTQIIIEQVLPLAKKYKDPYATGLAHGPVLVGIPAGGLPFDESKNGLIYHHYPSLDYADIYLHRALATLQHLLRMDAAANRQEYIHQVAHFCQLLINLHLFAAVNISLYMNMCNGLLELAGMRGIEHGIIDFVAFRLQPDNFGRYFYDMAKEGQHY